MTAGLVEPKNFEFRKQEGTGFQDHVMETEEKSFQLAAKCDEDGGKWTVYESLCPMVEQNDLSRVLFQIQNGAFEVC